MPPDYLLRETATDRFLLEDGSGCYLLEYSGYRAAVLNTSPIRYWRLGELSGTIAVDQMGVGDGTYSPVPTLGTTGLLTADINTAVTMAAASRASVADAAALSLTTTGSLSIVAWINPSATTFGAIVSKAAASQYEWGLFRGNDNGLAADRVVAFVYNAAGTIRIFQATPAGSAPNSSTVMVAVTVTDNVSLNISVNNGTPATSTVWTLTSTNGTSTLDIGVQGDGGASFLGVADEIAIWDRVLSAAEITTLYNAGLGVFAMPRLAPIVLQAMNRAATR